jgi:hypothetical protein
MLINFTSSKRDKASINSLILSLIHWHSMTMFHFAFKNKIFLRNALTKFLTIDLLSFEKTRVLFVYILIFCLINEETHNWKTRKMIFISYTLILSLSRSNRVLNAFDFEIFFDLNNSVAETNSSSFIRHAFV